MLKLLKAKVTPYMTYIVLAVIIAMAVALFALTNLYSDALTENGKLNTQLEASKAQVVTLTDQLARERDSRASIRESEEVLDTKYEGIRNEAQHIPTVETTPGLDTDAVAQLLCANGLATAEACSRANRPRNDSSSH